jgi:hypothetical protein
LTLTIEKLPSGAKAHVDFRSLMAVRAEALTYQSCPDTKRESDDLLINTPE